MYIRAEKVNTINKNGVTATKLNHDGHVILSNSNNWPVEIECRIFGMRTDNKRPDLLVSTVVTLGKKSDGTSVREITPGISSVTDFHKTYFTTVFDLSVKKKSEPTK
ncbi:MAG: hypothetical protein LBD21_03130 [Tannerellaceae bacterium]|jgi:hypothetical protein|nr:hypothetical protein [Tannerellaceae bacterium]